MRSALYQGQVRHRRHAPVENHFTYEISMLYLDLAELPHVFEREPLYSLDRPNLAWFRRADYLGPADVPLDEAVRSLVLERTGRRPEGAIRMLTQVRMLGYVFNPVTFYYCYDRADERVETIVAEITNTPWLERHAYVLESERGTQHGQARRFRFPKAFHVSPFLPMDVEHDWRFGEPGEDLHVHMEDVQAGRPVLDATLVLRRQPLRHQTLTRALLRRPWLTLKITGAIYFQALRLWWKRCPFFPHPRRAFGREEGRSDVRRSSEHAPRPDRSLAPAPRPASRSLASAGADRRVSADP